MNFSSTSPINQTFIFHFKTWEKTSYYNIYPKPIKSFNHIICLERNRDKVTIIRKIHAR